MIDIEVQCLPGSLAREVAMHVEIGRHPLVLRSYLASDFQLRLVRLSVDSECSRGHCHNDFAQCVLCHSGLCKCMKPQSGDWGPNFGAFSTGCIFITLHDVTVRRFCYLKSTQDAAI